ncbi:E5 [Canis familiaris papillomavirus 11]|uniref:E5 n=1 Tax=Canis familiaris papillomavirus 11 TaxID=1091166 RepID=G4XF81_9PAPI|nr:E5 [Canis familiaris papillomavirus 11]
MLYKLRPRMTQGNGELLSSHFRQLSGLSLGLAITPLYIFLLCFYTFVLLYFRPLTQRVSAT